MSRTVCAPLESALENCPFLVLQKSIPKVTAPVVETAVETTGTFRLADIPLGTCCQCKTPQTLPAQGGIWIDGSTDQWACYACKYGHHSPAIRSHYFGTCEWCTSADTIPYQGNTYHCRRCAALGIKH